MADVRCPMCSKPNPEDADVCSFCGARLKPLVAGESGEPTRGQEQPAGPPESGGEEAVPDWLARIRSKAQEERAEEEPSEPEEPAEGPDWLSRLRRAEPLQEEGAPEGEVPSWLESPEGEQEAGGEVAAPESEGEGGAWLDRLRESTSEDVGPDEGPLDHEDIEAPEEKAPSSEDMSWVGELEEEPTELDERLETEAPAEPEEPDLGGMPPGFERGTEPEIGAEAADAAEEDWLADLGEGGQDAGALPDWIGDLSETGEDEAPELTLPTEEESQPPETPVEATSTEASEPFEPAEPSQPMEEGESDATFDWDEIAYDWDVEGEEPPALLPEEEEAELPHVPALIMGDEEESPTQGADEFDLDAVELPDWLGDVRSDAGEGEHPERGDLAPATIPAWLEAMRPVETFQPVVDIEPEEEQVVESVGPLAGLRGVLLAEPVVAKPHTATASGARLEVTERQYAQAQFLQRIVEEEEQEVPAPVSSRRPLPIVRWLVSLAVLLAVFLPSVTGFPAFAVPTRVSRDLGPLVGIVNTLPSDRPVLLVFDFEPGYSGELDAVAQPLIENLMARGINIVTLSTRPTGPPLAVDLIDKIGAAQQLQDGQNILHLGYLSGGPSAVQLFAAAPRQAILKGFMLPADLQSTSAWNSPILSNVNRLSDFGMVAVIAAGTDTARTWAEQAHPWLGNTPLVMVLSQGAEPMIRPYFESLNPQVNGILSGLPTALAYEELNGRRGLAFDRWNGFGAGSLAVELVLMVGMVYGAVAWFMSRRQA